MTPPEILVIHKEYLCAKDIQNRLTNMGYSVPFLVLDIADIFEKIADMRPDIVLLDSDITGAYDSLDIAQDIQEDFRVPVILLSVDMLTSELYKWGYYCCSLKPIKEKELSLMIDLAYARHTLERKVYEQDQLLIRIMNNCHDGIITLDQQDRITFINSVAEQLIGWKYEEIHEKSLSEILKTEDQVPSEILNRYKAVRYSDQIIISRSGERRQVDLLTEPINDGDGSLTRTLLILRDSHSS